MKPRNWHAVAAHQRNSAGPMGKRPDRGPSVDEWEWEPETRRFGNRTPVLAADGQWYEIADDS